MHRSADNLSITHVAFAATLAAAAALILLAMGREPICECGYVKLWHGVTASSENSQHLSDWYSPSHVIHGFVFYGLAWLFLRRAPLGVRFVLAVCVEAGWEIIENTEFIIDRYREQTIALDYYGDSVLNSVADILFMAAGFLLAARLPVWATTAIAVALELFTGFMIRDNLTLNVVMLLWPLESIRAWQGGL
jgi:hypothetical protein